MTTLPTSDRAAQLQQAKANYCQRLTQRYDNIKFSGISVATQETEKSSKLISEIFVMLDVVEEVSRLDSPSMHEEFHLESTLSENRTRRKFSAQDLLSKTRSKKIVLVGAPGSGKTTLSIYFALMLAHDSPKSLGLSPDKDWLPIIIRIRDWIRYPDTSVIDYLWQFVVKTMSVSDLPPGFFQHWLEDGRALILFDGLDEVPEESRRYAVVEEITAFLAEYPQNPVIITSRPAGYRRDFFRTQEFPHYQLQPFDDRQIEQFITYWYNSRIPDPVEATRRKESLKKVLDENDRIKLLARNPLLLNIIVLIHRYQAYLLPIKRYNLYNVAIDTLLTAWDANKEISGYKELHYLDLDDLRRLMEILAYWVHQKGNRGDKEGVTLIERKALIYKLTEEIKIFKQIETGEAEKEAIRFVNYIRDRTGLLNEQGRDVYAFVHKTFQEYLCAQEIYYQQQDYGFEVISEHIHKYLHDPHWREVLLLLVAQQTPKKAARAIRAILDRGSEYEQWLDRDLLFAGSCLVENPKNLKAADNKLPQDILERLVELEASDEDLVGERVRQQVFQTLCSLYETDFQKQALELLKSKSDRIDKNRFLKYRAALGKKEAVIKNLLGLLKEEDSVMRRYAASALGNLGIASESVLAALLERLKDKDYVVRRLTAEALGNLGIASDEVGNALLKLLKDDSSSSLVRGYAAQALGKLGIDSDEVLDALLKLLKHEDYSVTSMPSLRCFAIEALGKLGIDSDEVLDTLLKLLEQDDYSMRRFTANALGRLGIGSDTKVVDALRKRLEDDDYLVRGFAAQALGRLGRGSDTKVVDVLLDGLEEEDFWVRGFAAEALGNLGKQSSEVLPAVVQWLQQHQDSKYIGRGIDALWDLVKAEV
ncbi:MAG: HEAT repeat domain-containing protein [Prochloraceae cyanobacterium]|nr:HEAT repeat domain-containing protein [Prochloraceae cyanobacterium]